MNRIIIALAAALAFPALAEDAPPDKASPEKAEAAAIRLPRAEAMQKMQDNTKKMQGLLARISKAKNDGERQKLLAEYQQSTEENLAISKGLAASVDCPNLAEDAGDDGEGKEALQERVRQLEKRLDRMQATLNQGAPRPAKARPAPPAATPGT